MPDRALAELGAECSPLGHVPHFASAVVPAKEAIALAARLLAPGATRRELTALLFDNRAKPDTVKKWQEGRRAMPRWAGELLSAKLQARGREHVAAAQIVLAVPFGPGQACDPTAATLRAWHARQAAIRNGPADPSP